MTEYVPMHERKRRAAVKRSIAARQRDIKALWKQFHQVMKTEPQGSPMYEHHHRAAVLAARDIEFDIGAMMLRLPPHLVWNDYMGCLERVAVEFANA